MYDDEVKQLLIFIIDNAKTAKSTEFHFIRNWSDYRYCYRSRTSLKCLVKSLQRVSKRMIKKYCKGIKSGTGNFNQLLAYQQLQIALKFYQAELDTYTNMVYEYDAYLMESCNFLSSVLFGWERPTEDLRDFRE